MTKRYAALLFPICAAVLAACSGGGADDEGPVITAEAAADMSMTDMADRLIEDGRSLGTLLSGVDGEASAEAVRPQVEAMVENYRVLGERFEALGEPSFSEMAALASRLPDMARTQAGVVEQVQRIYNDHPEAADILRDALDDAARAAP
ncbi:MAG: hypothetical protein AAF311_10625 [Pseudomonadota bacterium]